MSLVREGTTSQPVVTNLTIHCLVYHFEWQHKTKSMFIIKQVWGPLHIILRYECDNLLVRIKLPHYYSNISVQPNNNCKIQPDCL